MPIFRYLPIGRRRQRALLQDQPVTIVLAGAKPVFKVDERYLSFSIDISVLAGGFWWEGSKGTNRGLGTVRVEALNLRSKKLDKLVNALGMSYLRVGGSEADKIHYFEAPEADKDALVLTQDRWDHLHSFVQRNKLKLMFTFKYGLFQRRQHGSWQGSEILRLLAYSKRKGYEIDVCELGNELNAYWAFHGLSSQPAAQKLARDYATFAQLIREYFPTSKICGPGSAFWPRLGETITPFSNITKRFLESLTCDVDIVDWHYYPFQGERSPVRTRSANLSTLLSPNSFEGYSKYAIQLRDWRDSFQSQAQLWTGETGSAQCGGQPKLSDRFASCFWWADQLGRGAALGQSVMVRQSLIGGDYGLVDRLSLKPKPDFWISWLWVNLMGRDVYAVTSSDGEVKTYCHATPKGGRRTLLIINMSEHSKRINCKGFGASKKRFEVTAKHLKAKKVQINGVTAKFNQDDLRLSSFPKKSKQNTVQAYSINFWCFAG